MPTAVIIRARLPAGLEAIRRRAVDDAAHGLPAHMTMLYPFVEPDALGPDVRRAIAAVARRHDPIPYRLTGPHRWPEAVYAGVEPGESLVRLQADLAAAFPDHPIYGEPPGFVFVPHITVAAGDAIRDDDVLDTVAWNGLPVAARAEALEVIARGDDGRWRTRWRIGLGQAAAR